MARTFRKADRDAAGCWSSSAVRKKTKNKQLYYADLFKDDRCEGLKNSQIFGKVHLDGTGNELPSRVKRDWNRKYRRTSKHKLKIGPDDFQGFYRHCHIYDYF